MTPALSKPRYRPIAESGCQAALDRREWAATSTFSIGPWSLGVRSTTHELDEALRALLGACLRPKDTAPQNYSLWLSPKAGRGEPRGLHAVYQGCTLRWRARSATELVQALLHQLETDVLLEQRDTLPLAIGVLVVGGGAVALPAHARYHVLDVARRFAAAGAPVWPAPLVGVDRATGEIVLPAPSFVLDDHAWERIAALDGRPPMAPPWPAPGRYRLGTWLELPWRNPVPPTRGWVVMNAFHSVPNRAEMPTRSLLEALAAMVRPAEVVAISPQPNMGAAVLDAIQGLSVVRRKSPAGDG